jgi:Zn-dependent protease
MRHWGTRWGVADHVRLNFFLFLSSGSVINLVLFVFNMLPVPPLDGSRIAASFIPKYREVVYDPRAVGPLLIVFILIFIWGGDLLFDKATDLVMWGVDAVIAAMP